VGTTESVSEEELHTALKHPLRRQILRLMQDGNQASPRELADELEQPLSNVSYHVRVLVQCGAVKLVDTEPRRGSLEHFYEFAVEKGWALESLASAQVTGTPRAAEADASDDDGGGAGES
jgi:DNA-binding transcriptional ArsR family regulator